MTPTAEAAPDVVAVTQRRISLANAYVGEAEAGAARELISSGCIAMGAVTARLERELAASLGGSEVVLVSSGTAALHLSMLIAGIGPGDEVLVPSMVVRGHCFGGGHGRGHAPIRRHSQPC